MTDANLEREIGRLEAQVEVLQKQQDEMDKKLDTLVEFMSSAKGSWRALVGVAALASAITAAVFKVWALLR